MHGHHHLAPDLSAQDTAEDGRYIIDNRMEVLAILRALRTRKALVAAYLEKAEDFILTALIAVHPDSDEIVLDAGTRPELNRSILAEDCVVCITAQDGVKVRFTLNGVERVLFEGYEAFSAVMPAAVLRVQRRDYYRVPAPATTPLKCTIPLPPTRGQSPAAELIVMDLSAGGIGLMDHHHLIDLEPGNRYRRCRMDLPGVGQVTFDMEVKTSFEVTLPSGMTCKRSGCEFLDLPSMTEGALQRYILQLERERNARVRRHDS